MFKLFLVLGSLNALLAVAIGAFGAHGLQSKVSERMMEIFQTGVQYHMFHAIGLIVVAFTADKLGNSPMIVWSGWLMLAGIIVFSGSLYTLSISGISKLGMVTPLGGIAFIAGWALLLAAAWKLN